jgi:hypothetical protein
VLAVIEWWLGIYYIERYIMDAKDEGVKMSHMVPVKVRGVSLLGKELCVF